MARVCKSGGRVAVADVFTTSAAQQALYDRAEKLRDPSHTRTLQLEQMKSLFQQAGLQVDYTEFYRLEVELERILLMSATAPDAAEQFRQILTADLGTNATGMSPRRTESAVYFSFPVVVMAGRKAG
jgi:hypothetical protein